MSCKLTFTDLAGEACKPLSGAGHSLGAAQLADLLALLPGWESNGKEIVKSFVFADYDRTLDFVNIVACIAREQDHHPDIAFGYNRCRIAYATHSVGGISLNDLICAAKIEALPCP
ncbi:MAG: 4a-hydroxytetrahydrobiopterin dehydratase [Rhodocyclaceae bacterium]|nr:4a-hydroxytetrahydrobiopterin dehydratase [Rhodocyclaceae bacterium]